MLAASMTVYAMRVGAMACAFGSSVLIARTLGKQPLGIYNIGFTVFTLCVVFAKFGFDGVALRAIASELAIGKTLAAQKHYLVATTTTALLACVMAAALYSNSRTLAAFFGNDFGLAYVFSAFAFAIIPSVFTSIQAQVLKGMKRPISAATVEYGIAAPLFLALLMYVESDSIGWAPIAYGISQGVSAAVGALICQSMFRKPVASITQAYDFAKTFASCTKMFAASSLDVLLKWSDVLVVGYFCSTVDAGGFGVASRVASLLSITLVAISSVTAPRYAELYAKGDLEELAKTARKASALGAVLTAPLFLTMFILPNAFLRMFGGSFVDDSALLQILALGHFVNVATGNVGYILAMTNREAVLLKIVFSFTASGIVLNCGLAQHFGTTGVATGTAICLAGTNLAAWFATLRLLGINTVFFLPSGRTVS